MAKGKSTFVELRCPETGIRVATRTINKSQMKPADLAAKIKIVSPGSKKRVTPIVKEISRAKKK
jgi:hypothetical protein